MKLRPIGRFIVNDLNFLNFNENKTEVLMFRPPTVTARELVLFFLCFN